MNRNVGMFRESYRLYLRIRIIAGDPAQKYWANGYSDCGSSRNIVELHLILFVYSLNKQHVMCQLASFRVMVGVFLMDRGGLAVTPCLQSLC